jgi:hypothetical protein
MSTVPGSPGGTDCADYFADPPDGQSDDCIAECGPITPNGCDCFGCCDVNGSIVWIGNEHGVSSSDPSVPPEYCELSEVTDPVECPPCVQVPSCVNSCERCEICIGKPTVPADCNPDAQCPGGEQPCGLAGQELCPTGFYCVTGCCQPTEIPS